MDEETDRLNNLCADLVSVRRLEPAVVCLILCKAAGEWTPVGELYQAAGGTTEPIKPELVAAWLPAPGGDPDYVVIVFFDDETQWSMTAYHNKARLLSRPDRAATKQ